MTENKKKHKFTLRPGFLNNHGNILFYDSVVKDGESISTPKICNLLNKLYEENEELKQENKKILDTINNKITQLGMDWYGAEDNSKEEKEANLQLSVLEEVKEEIIETMIVAENKEEALETLELMEMSELDEFKIKDVIKYE